MFKRLKKFVLIASRLSLGIVLVFCTSLVAGMIGQLAFGHRVPLATRFQLVLASLFFAAQTYAAFRILIFRRRVGPDSHFRPPGGSPGWPLGIPVPVRPSGPWLVRAAAEAVPRAE